MSRFFAVMLAVILCSFFPFTVFAQTGLSLEAEIKNLETAAVGKDIPPAGRHDTLVRLARLRQLSGNIEGAARSWFEAAGAIPGRVDDDALLSCAYCLAAMGEWERAATALEPLLAKYARARFLNTSIKAIKTGDLSELAALADNAEYSQLKHEILFILWKLSDGARAALTTEESSPFQLGGGAQMWRQRLIAEFPLTTEGRLAAAETSSSIAIRLSAFWLFAGGLDSLPLAAAPAPGNIPSAAQPASVTKTPPVEQPKITPAPALAASIRFQTGVFGRESNAQAQITNLQKAGFTAAIEQRNVNGNQMWAVTVPAGADQTKTAAALRSAGFDSFLIK
ncbi:MAG: SPOR domain-containing protein [Treponema sp.]|nr:SPOR domain-containing protein [Treponema sp.]